MSENANTDEIYEYHNFDCPIDSSEMDIRTIWYDWMADSGTTSHIIHRRDVFINYHPIPERPISGVGGLTTHAIGCGDLNLRSHCSKNTFILWMHNVLYMPRTKTNLLSLGRWEHDRCTISIKDSVISLIMPDGRIAVHGSKTHNNLYKITFEHASQVPMIDCSFSAFSTSPNWVAWHRRFGHVAYGGIKKLFDFDLLDGAKVNLKSSKPDCVACTEAKLFQLPYEFIPPQQSEPGELTHMDLWGKYDITSINGNRYYLLMVDDASRHVTVEFLKSKDQAAQKIKDYLTYLRVRGKIPYAIRTDRGTEFVKHTLQSWCEAQGIELQLTAPYSPSQNGVAECMIRTLTELTRAMLAAAKMPEFLWEPAIAHAAYLRNISYTRKIPTATPYQIWNGKKPNVSHLREFGAPVWVLLQGQHIQRKLLPKSQRRVYVGYDDGSKAVKYYNPATRNILTSRNFHFIDPADTEPPDEPEEIAIVPEGERPPQIEGEYIRPLEPQAPSREGEMGSGTQNVPVSPIRQRKRKAEEEIDPREPRKTRGIRVDYKYMNDPFPDEEEAGIVVIREEAFAVMLEEDPQNLQEAQRSGEWPEWERAIQAELDQLKKMGTWQLVDKPTGAVPIANKWVFAKKRDKEGNITKYKARLVAKGCSQRPGYDYLETHSPVVRMETIRALLALAPTRKLLIHQMDIKGAYLNGNLKERVYMRQPEGYGDESGRVCLLVKTLYSLKQAGREWNRELDNKLRRRGYARLRSDPCVYIWRTGEDFAIITVWVDDLLIFATSEKLMATMKNDLHSKWEVTDMGEPAKIVGIEITWRENSITIMQTKYIEAILE